MISDPLSNKSILLVGLGAIGRFLAELLARDPRIGSIILVDPQSYDADNITSQNIAPAEFRDPAHGEWTHCERSHDVEAGRIQERLQFAYPRPFDKPRTHRLNFERAR